MEPCNRGPGSVSVVDGDWQSAKLSAPRGWSLCLRSWLVLFALNLCGWAQPTSRTGPPEPGGAVVIKPPLRAEQGSQPRVVLQTVPDTQVTATVLAIRYRRPGDSGGASAGIAHLLEHMLYRSRSGSPPGSLLVRSESLGGQTLAYLTSGVIVLGEVVPSEQGLESLDLQLERLRAVSSDASDLALEKSAIVQELTVSAVRLGPEELGRRGLLAGLGVQAGVEGDAETISRATPSDLERLLEDLSLETDIAIAVVGPHTEQQVQLHLTHALKRLRPSREQARPREATEAQTTTVTVESPSGFHQASYFLRLPELSTAETLLMEDLLRQATAEASILSLSKEDVGLYRLDVSPPQNRQELGQRLGLLQPDDDLGGRLRRAWLDRYEGPLQRAEMLALEALELGTAARPLAAEELEGARERLLLELQSALARAPLLQLEPRGSRRPSGLYPFQTRARAGAIQRQTLSNGLVVAWQDLKSWPTVGISGFFRLRRVLAPDECAALEKELEIRSTHGLDYEVKPDALFFHCWCPAPELRETLEKAASELRALAESDEVLVKAAATAPSAMEEFFLAGLGRAQSSDLSGRTLIRPDAGQLVLVGDLDAMAMEHGLRPAWNSWFPEKPSRPSSLPAVRDGAVESQRTVDVSTSQPPLLLVGIWGPNRSSPDFLAFNLALQSFAGRPTTSLLARQLRDNEGLVETVSVFPMLGSERSDGQQLWLIALRPRTRLEDGADLAARVASGLAGLGRDALPETELARTRNYLKAALKVSISTPRGRARVLANSEFNRLSDLYSTDYAGLYDRINAAVVRAACQRYLGGQSPRWLYLRPAPQAP